MNNYRHEYKYLLDYDQMMLTKLRAKGLMHPDSHVNSAGRYLIRSLYFDDDQDTCYRENEDGYNIRHKYRIRYYNNDTSYITLEKKSKLNGMTLKEQARLGLEECKLLMAGDIPKITSSMDEKLSELLAGLKLDGVRPKVIVQYEREPYIYEAGNVRVTFDENILSSNEIERFLEADFAVRPVLKKGESLLEVKWDDVLPRHIADYMSLDKLMWSGFSKYYYCRRYDLYGGITV